MGAAAAAARGERAVADIQLLGSHEQIVLVQQFATDLGEGRTAELNPLLNSLRDSLRDELDAGRTMRRLVWLRIGRGPGEGRAQPESTEGTRLT